jgi:TfoX/Sxy family transcriptional regulator of competence genes
MPYNEKLAERTREIIAATHTRVEEKKMFGGVCFMVNDKMCVGVVNDLLMVRLSPLAYDTALEQPGCLPMDFTGRTMKGFVFVEDEVLNTQKRLNYWVQLALDFNKEAKPTKKKITKKRPMQHMAHQ